MDKYLTAVYQITKKGEQKATTSQIAKELDVSDASATEAIQKLEKENLVCRAPYKGFTLSPMGKTKAQKLIEKQETVEKYLKQELKVDKPQQQAQAIAPNLTEQTIQKMKQKISETSQ